MLLACCLAVACLLPDWMSCRAALPRLTRFVRLAVLTRAAACRLPADLHRWHLRRQRDRSRCRRSRVRGVGYQRRPGWHHVRVTFPPAATHRHESRSCLPDAFVIVVVRVVHATQRLIQRARRRSHPRRCAVQPPGNVCCLSCLVHLVRCATFPSLLTLAERCPCARSELLVGGMPCCGIKIPYVCLMWLQTVRR